MVLTAEANCPANCPHVHVAVNRVVEVGGERRERRLRLDVLDNGDVFVGEFRGGVKNAHGVFKWADGAVFDGLYAHDKRAGRGKMTLADGSVFVGRFVDDLRDGLGGFKMADGADEQFHGINPEVRAWSESF